MSDPLLYPQLDASFYTVTSGIQFKHNDQLVTIQDFDVEHDPNTGMYAVEVNSTTQPLRFESRTQRHWPRAIRDLYWEHVKRRKQ